jgi:ABC-type antimicrobial peptide transport system permease subunit
MAAVKMAANDFAGIKSAVRYTARYLNIRYDTSETFAEYVHFTDPAFFELFNFPLVAGNPDINDPGAVLLTESVAKKYFGNQDPVGKALVFYAGESYARVLTVKGVLKEPPENSMFQFGMVTKFDNLVKEDGQKIGPDDWTIFVHAAFFKVPDQAGVAVLEKALTKYLPLQNKAREDARIRGFKLVTIRQAASWPEGAIGSNQLYRRPSDAATYGPLVLAFLIFLSSCLNFSNTTVSHAGKRLKEIGMRKVMGSTYVQLMFQLLTEYAVIVMGAILLSILMNKWWIPAFNSMFRGINVRADYLHDPTLVVFMGCMLVASTLMAGIYPAIYMSRFSPSSIFRGTVRFSGSNLFSRIMLGLQLSIAFITVIAGIAFARNSEFQRNYDYGYNIESNMLVGIPDSSTYFALKNELSSMPEIISLAGSRHHFAFDHQAVVAESEGAKHEIDCYEVGMDYPRTMGLKLAAGRGFDDHLESDYKDALLITEKMAATYGWNPSTALGKRIQIDTGNYHVVGMLKDFHSQTLFEPLQPIALKLSKENKFRFLIIQTKPKDLSAVFKKVKDTWKRLYPLKPFWGVYQNEVKAEAYNVTSSIATIFAWFAIISVLLTATGLFALISLTILKKMKEIALRKVVGAGPRDILLLISKGYVWIFMIGALLGCFAGLALTRLLLELIFKINVGVSFSSVLWSFFAMFIVIGITAGIKVRQAVRTNPVSLLRAE